MYSDIFNEDDDWDIYQPGIAQETSNLPSNNSVNSCGTTSEWNEKRMLKKVKKYFLKNPVQQTDNLSHRERMTRIIISPYFKWDFALRHNLYVPTTTLIEELKLLKDPPQEWRVQAAFELMLKSGVSDVDFFFYMSMDSRRPFHMSPRKWNTCSGLDPSTIQHLDRIQEQVGRDIFPVILDHFKAGDAEFLAILHHKESLNLAIQFWEEYETNVEVLRRHHEDKGYNFLTQNQADSYGMSYDVKSEDTLVSQTNADFSSRSHAIKTPGHNGTDSNAYADDSKAKAHQNVLRTSRFSADISKGQSTKPDDIFETQLNQSLAILQSTNQGKEIRSSFESCQNYSDKSTDPPDSASILLPRNQDSNDQSDKVNSRKVHSVKSRNSPKNATHSSDQNFKENSRHARSANSLEILENVSNAQTGIREHISLEDEAKSRKKIRLQENPNTGQRESKKEESPIKDESRNPSEES